MAAMVPRLLVAAAGCPLWLERRLREVALFVCRDMALIRLDFEFLYFLDAEIDGWRDVKSRGKQASRQQGR